jgi:hypothetical protein
VAHQRVAVGAALVAYFESHADALDAEARRRLHSNPLRILDSKHAAMQPIIEAAPKLIDHLGAESRAHFDALRALLDAAGLAYRINPRLVRGMDYYNLTVFEWVTDRLGSQGTVCGGGRYDGLIEQLGGKPAPAIGFGLGIERLLLLLQEARVPVPSGAPLAYAIVPSADVLPPALVAIEALRAGGVSVLMNAGFGGMKAQFKRADSSCARYALVFGASEVAQGQLALKDLRDANAAQSLRPLAGAAQWAAELVLHVGEGALHAGDIAALRRTLDFVVHRGGLGALRALPVLPAVPGGDGAEDGDDHPGDEVAVLVPEMLDLGKLFLFFEIEVFCHCVVVLLGACDCMRRRAARCPQALSVSTQVPGSARGRCTCAPAPSRKALTVTMPWASSSAPKMRA